MRKIEAQMNKAISDQKDWRSGNTEVEQFGANSCNVYLHGNLIAEINHLTKACKISNAGWATPTTKSRLNAILHQVTHCMRTDIGGKYVYQKQGQWFISDMNTQSRVEFKDGFQTV
tara:strand:- start:75 stop:422 length:348 start_codon:yes stop_codon:yes gene_type:complete